MDAARQGIVTPQMKIVAEKEHYDAEALRELIAKGEAIIPCNRNHKRLSPSGVGAKLKTKINVNLGVSRDWKEWTWNMRRFAPQWKWERRLLWISVPMATPEVSAGS